MKKPTGIIRLDSQTFIIPIERNCYALGRPIERKKKNFIFDSYHFNIESAVRYYLEKIAYKACANGTETMFADYVEKLSCVLETTLAEYLRTIESERGNDER